MSVSYLVATFDVLTCFSHRLASLQYQNMGDQSQQRYDYDTGTYRQPTEYELQVWDHILGKYYRLIGVSGNIDHYNQVNNIIL